MLSVFVLLASALAVSQGRLDTHIVEEVCAGVSHPASLLQLLNKTEAEALESKEDLAACIRDTLTWQEDLARKELWALRMLDSSSKGITGLWFGTTSDLGNFDECVMATPPSSAFSGRYSLPTVSVWEPMLQNQDGEGGGNATWQQSSTFQFAFCAPSSCSPGVLEAGLRQLLRQLNSQADTQRAAVQLQAELPASHTALQGRHRKADAADWAVISLTLLCMFIVIGATIADCTGGTNGSQNFGTTLIKAFSARANGRQLFKISSSGGGSLSCINGIRTLTAFWIVCSHSFFSENHSVPELNTIEYPFTDISFSTLLFFQDVSFAVDTFLAVGGIVNCFVFMKKITKEKSFDFFQFVYRRFLRITPAMMFVLAASATWVSLVGSGPTWFHLEEVSDKCRLSWWSNLIYLANWVNADNQCQVMWYMSTDMQLYVLSPLVMLPLWKSRRLGLYWWLFMVLLFCAVPLAVAYIWSIRYVYPLGYDSQFYLSMVYWGAHMRAAPYLAGLFFGYLLHEIQANKMSFKPKPVLVWCGWLLSTALAFAVILGIRPMLNTETHAFNRIESTLYVGLSRLAWGIAISWVVLACATGHSGPVNAILSWSPFEVLGRLSYGIYITHYMLILIESGASRSATYRSAFGSMKTSTAYFFMGAVLSVLVNLLVEAPVVYFDQWLQRRAKKKCPDHK